SGPDGSSRSARTVPIRPAPIHPSFLEVTTDNQHLPDHEHQGCKRLHPRWHTVVGGVNRWRRVEARRPSGYGILATYWPCPAAQPLNRHALSRRSVHEATTSPPAAAIPL